MFKKKLMYLCSIMVALSAISLILVSKFGKADTSDREKLTIVTSFYPMYIIAANLADNIPGVEVINLTENLSGCLHDYQLTTQDMRVLNQADIFIMNGAGMEEFMENILSQYTDKKIINASEGIPLLKGSGHAHDHSADDEIMDTDTEQETVNGHVWMDLEYYQQQINTVGMKLAEYDEIHAAQYMDNIEKYKDKVQLLQQEYNMELKNLRGLEIISFHDGFAYLAEQIGIEVIHTVNLDEETSLNAGEIAEVIDDIRRHQIQYLFTEEQYKESIAANISTETKTQICTIDFLVSGSKNKDAYLEGMQQNLQVLKEIVKLEDLNRFKIKN